MSSSLRFSASVLSINQVIDPQFLTIHTMVQGRITALQTLDREVTDTYQLQLVARDSRSNPRMASIPVTITVVDENDNSPVFSAGQRNFSLVENTNDTFIMEFTVSSVMCRKKY